MATCRKKKENHGGAYFKFSWYEKKCILKREIYEYWKSSMNDYLGPCYRSTSDTY